MEQKFKIVSNKIPKGDQIKAIRDVTKNLKGDIKEQILLGATGTGKTYTIAKVIEKHNKQALVIAPNKTLAGQLYAELKSYFPNNRVEYFISNFDYYRPEAYVVSSDTYVEKNSKINWEIEMMRTNATNSLLTRNDTIVVASVAAIYSLRDPRIYKAAFFEIEVKEKLIKSKFTSKLVKLGYERNNIEAERGRFKVIGDVIDLYTPASKDWFLRVSFLDDEIEFIKLIDAESLKSIKSLNRFTIFPVDSNLSKDNILKEAIPEMEKELEETLDKFKKENKLLEAQRLENRTKLDIEQLSEYGTCSGIENYSMYLDQRKFGDTPFTIMDYFKDDFVLIADESHVSIPQIRGMYAGDRSRKENLVNYGFRLPSALENRPLNFDEFYRKTRQIIYLSATPGDYEVEKNLPTTELIIRPTGLVDPVIKIESNNNRLDKVYNEILKQVNAGERTLITTLTINMSIELTKYLRSKKLKVAYINSELKTLERDEVIRRLRIGVYDVLVGINLLREGLDIPEVSLVMIFDADKEGFLRNYRSLIQTIGRASRNVNGRVILFADKVTESMNAAIEETNRRRDKQLKYNKKNNIKPKTIEKEIPPKFIELNLEFDSKENLSEYKVDKRNIKDTLYKLNKQMEEYSSKLDFENAMKIRDIIIEIKAKIK